MLLRSDSVSAHPEHRFPSAKPFPQTTSGRQVAMVSVSTSATSACPTPSEEQLSVRERMCFGIIPSLKFWGLPASLKLKTADCSITFSKKFVIDLRDLGKNKKIVY
ncbi:hypothetical protein KEJ18_00610 [Candidatus Bathyarchaeota archaeon]|nr:hypothetical protein [Candidatus Bathyarchaeota archaeon]